VDEYTSPDGICDVKVSPSFCAPEFAGHTDFMCEFQHHLMLMAIF